MTKKEKYQADKNELRYKAEEVYKKSNKENVNYIEFADNLKLLHELQVHQIELEMQNEQLRQAQGEIGEALEKYEDLFEFAPVSYFALDRDGILLKLNLTGSLLLGLDRSQIIGRKIIEFFLESKRLEFQEIIKKVFNKEEITNFDTILKLKEKIINVQVSTKLSNDEKECRLMITDVTEQKILEKQLEYLSMHDELTGLYNRRFFEEELYRLDTERNLPISIIFADVNGLKIINDAFGHHTGDQLLKKVAFVLTNEFRVDDIIARIGGDEFLILLPKTEKIVAENICGKIKSIIEDQKISGINISISLGWETKETIGKDILRTINIAEDLMYNKKIFENSSKSSNLIKSILNTLLVKSPREEAHSLRVGQICEDMGKIYNLSEDKIKILKTSGELHDIGKIIIDEAILNKKGKLTKNEWAEIKRHPEMGGRILGISSEFRSLSGFVVAHHEWWNGNGYPIGLKEESIIWEARIIAIADAYDAMTSRSVFKNILNEKEAIAEIKRCAGTQFDPEIAKVFVEKFLKQKW